ncbi:hypothetical protein BLOT_006598 [Blomia tropicalis]|nr:hypothetical protein BLOT_006598 [Blomia tropicalis]
MPTIEASNEGIEVLEMIHNENYDILHWYTLMSRKSVWPIMIHTIVKNLNPWMHYFAPENSKVEYILEMFHLFKYNKKNINYLLNQFRSLNRFLVLSTNGSTNLQMDRSIRSDSNILFTPPPQQQQQ